MNTVLIRCDLCETNVNVEDTIDLCRETDQYKEEFILCETCFQRQGDRLRDEGWNVDDFITETDPEEDIMDNDLGPNFVFTQYLYSAEDVSQALATNILLKNKEKTQFWISELLRSELTDHLICLLWNIYFSYYFALNPEFYNYLLKQTKRMHGTNDLAELDAAATDIAANLMIRPFNTDVLREGMRDADLPSLFFPEHIDDLMVPGAVETFMTTVAGDQIKPTNYKKVTTLFRNLDKLRANPFKVSGGDLGVPIDVECAARRALICSYVSKLKMGKALFVTPSVPITITSETEIIVDNVLQKQTTVSMSEESSFCAYDEPVLHGDADSILSGASDAVRRAFGQHWEYYAHRAPLWERRITAHGGTPDHGTRKIRWSSDDDQKRFYASYGYDPDEVGYDIASRCIAIGLRRLNADEYCAMLASTCSNAVLSV
jgi:hypothetical protein